MPTPRWIPGTLGLIASAGSAGNTIRLGVGVQAVDLQGGRIGDLPHSGRRYSVGLTALDGIPTAAYSALDANTDISNSNWTFRLFVKNLTDERAYLTAFSFADINGAVVQNEGIVLQPRTIGLAVDYEF